MLVLIAIWTLVASVVAGILYAVDKRAARRDSRRVSEKTLLLWSLAGGWPGAWLVGQRIRHKTQKRSFRLQFAFCVVVNVTITAIMVARDLL
ncbi:hypothetical protein Q31b_05380 [Novipirellula aureliae]|uniref:DUF1294 domain-containing protein n=1 Tax=Novipirellula aureliae TaxID=2527966 RepID=A0A5C6ECT9_9BACT|nr:DUF1294 domain-containing protein [Novipirellula aureliae]TWU45366.1 hypothetical protein Q31b_05380 [Novipirellula aureliae]